MADRQEGVAARGAEMYVCSVHGRWTRISRPEGDTMRPCPECPPGQPAPPVLSKRPLTGLTA